MCVCAGEAAYPGGPAVRAVCGGGGRPVRGATAGPAAHPGAAPRARQVQTGETAKGVLPSIIEGFYRLRPLSKNL